MLRDLFQTFICGYNAMDVTPSNTAEGMAKKTAAALTEQMERRPRKGEMYGAAVNQTNTGTVSKAILWKTQR